MLTKLIIRLLGFLLFLCVLQFFVVGIPLDEEDLLGMTPAQVRAECGEPYRIWDFDPNDNEVEWIYNHGVIGTQSKVTFNNDIAVNVSVRFGK